MHNISRVSLKEAISVTVPPKTRRVARNEPELNFPATNAVFSTQALFDGRVLQGVRVPVS